MYGTLQGRVVKHDDGALQGKVGQHDDRVCLEVRTMFFSRHMESQVYQVSASYRDLLTKKTGLCFHFSSSLNKAALTKTSETAR